MKIPIDQPSETMWCMVTTSTCSSSSSCNNKTRSSGPACRSNGRCPSASASCFASNSTSRTSIATLPEQSHLTNTTPIQTLATSTPVDRQNTYNTTPEQQIKRNH